MKRAARGDKRTAAAAGEARFEHSSRHPDLKSLVEDHLLDSEDAAATAKWFPSRRGNSPRNPDVKSRKAT